MTSINDMARLAAAIAEPSRAAILVALMDGRALTAGELATAAGITRPTASGHLAQLADGGFLSLVRQGRHRYYRLSGSPVAEMLERMMALSAELAAEPALPVRTGPAVPALRRARTCYDHLAGHVAVSIAEHLSEQGYLEIGSDSARLTTAGSEFLSGLGLSEGRAGIAPPTCRPCLDWSERRPHIGGALGRDLFAGMVRQGWLRQGKGREVQVTPPGRAALERHFGLKSD